MVVSIIVGKVTVVVAVSFTMFEMDVGVLPVTLHILKLSIENMFTIWSVLEPSVLARTLPVSWYLHWITMSVRMVSVSKVTVIVVKCLTETTFSMSILPMSLSIFHFAMEVVSFHSPVSGRVHPSSTWKSTMLSIFLVVMTTVVVLMLHLYRNCFLVNFKFNIISLSRSRYLNGQIYNDIGIKPFIIWKL